MAEITRFTRFFSGARVRVCWSVLTLVSAACTDGAERIAPDDDGVTSLVDPALAALQRGDEGTLALELNDKITAMQEWASAFERDLAAFAPNADPDLRGSFRRWKSSHESLRADVKRFGRAGDATPSGRVLLDRLSALEEEARRLDDLRSARR